MFSRADKRLIFYPAGRPGAEYSVPEGTRIIGAEAFANASMLLKIHVPEGVERIEQRAFYLLGAFSEDGSRYEGDIVISLPDSLKEIQSGIVHPFLFLGGNNDGM